jgi:hypothetical protein|uniref:Uncharacterized protein n=1 Tax=viral metagenome TaxID=1070528 RepID=A0A6C0AH37_9ZZZZ
MEVINLSDTPTVSFGPGIELLMNDKPKKETVSVTDLDKLESELNDLSRSSIPTSAPPSTPVSFPRMENVVIEELPSVKFDIPEKPKDPMTWDGFKPFQGDPDKVTATKDSLKERFSYLRKLEDLELKGVRLTRKYTMDSSLEEMKGEYENIISEKERSNNVKFQGKMLMALITGVEFLNSKFDPFDVKLDGWADQVNENISDYDDIFAELHEKYKNKAKLAPELKLMFQLGGSAIMLHMTNTMFKSSVPGIDDIMKQNPELMQKFTQAAVNSMGASHPGFSGFVNSVQPTREPREVRREPREEKRPDMKGPSDINSLLSGLKPKTIQLDEGSTVSLSELNEMKDGLNSAKRGRKKRSEKNSMSLNL